MTSLIAWNEYNQKYLAKYIDRIKLLLRGYIDRRKNSILK